jgi:PleD family two-component response regulator
MADQPVATSAGPVPVTISLGLAAVQTGESEIDPEIFLRDADEALYAAKARGRNRVESAPVSRAAAQQSD